MSIAYGRGSRTLGAARCRALVALALTAALALAGCTGGKDVGRKPDGQSTAKGLTVAGEWPLTGLPAKGHPEAPGDGRQDRQLREQRPQVGLSKADLVTEELVEGGSTRLAVFFYQHVPELVGPVRSMRATDIGIVKPAKAVLVASGGAPPTVRRVKAAGITTFTEGATGYRARHQPAGAVQPVHAAARSSSSTLKAKDTVPSYLPFGGEDDLPGGRRPAGWTRCSPAGTPPRWTLRGREVRQPEQLRGRRATSSGPTPCWCCGSRSATPATWTRRATRCPRRSSPAPGKALLFHGGRVVRGHLEKSLDSTITLRTKAGALKVPAGHTWIELVPENGGRVAITKVARTSGDAHDAAAGQA